MGNDFVWEGVRLTDSEIRAAIAFHQKEATRCRAEYEKHEKRAEELLRDITPHTYTIENKGKEYR